MEAELCSTLYMEGLKTGIGFQLFFVIPGPAVSKAIKKQSLAVHPRSLAPVCHSSTVPIQTGAYLFAHVQ